MRSDSLASKKMNWKPALHSIKMLVTLPALVHNNVDNFVLVTDVLCWLGKESVDDLVEQFDISPGVMLDARGKFCNCLLML